MDIKEKERVKPLGEIVCNFVNAENTDQACLQHFENMEPFLAFSSDNFVENAKKAFRYLSDLNSLSQKEKEFLDLK